MSLKNGQKYSNTEFKIYTSEDTTRVLKGVYLIADGGYHRWRCLQCPTRMDVAISRVAWGSWIESVRKDVEAAFGKSCCMCADVNYP
jgi:hypothetical protein